jgi:hypothetical protein
MSRSSNNTVTKIIKKCYNNFGDDWDSIPTRSKDLSFGHHAWTSSGIHPALYNGQQ